MRCKDDRDISGGLIILIIQALMQVEFRKVLSYDTKDGGGLGLVSGASGQSQLRSGG